nr:LOW QUALITY PROTEIN: baculoviral IAP repeat-containing protein 7-A-like [Cherax quadricarinatus]
MSNGSKKFSSYDSLQFEKEHLETFIDWPIKWLNPSDLARDGFYYLRKDDHCACVFCQGIVGVWEEGDTPRSEHEKHFPNCLFIRGMPVGNIPIKYDEIFDSLSSVPKLQNRKMMEIDVCGTHSNGSLKHTLCLPQHSGPKQTDYLTYENRIKSFAEGPEGVKQKPEELAEAGFFYCDLSDHVRCFHCGNGIRNWKSNGLPWIEHARWYPECNFLLLTKGQDFIDKAQQERKPPVAPSNDLSVSAVKNVISEIDLNTLMELDIICEVISMGFPQDKVRAILQQKLEQTGQPFFNLQHCIQATLTYMEKELKHENRNLHHNVEDTSIIEFPLGLCYYFILLHSF